MRLGLGLGLGLPSRAGGPAAALIAAMSPAPDATRVGHINTLAAALQASGVWDLMSGLWVTAAHDAQAARLNWKSPIGPSLTPVNSPTFTVDRGYSGNGTSSYLESGMNMGADALYTRNSAHMGVWVGTNQGATSSDCGISNGFITTFIGGTSMRVRPNAGSNFDAPVTTSIGHSVWVRTGASAAESFKDGASIGSNTLASTALGSENFFVSARSVAGVPTGFSQRRIQAAHFGAQLSAGQVTSLYNALAAYMTAVGA